MIGLLAVAILSTAPPAEARPAEPPSIFDLPAPIPQREAVLDWTARYVRGGAWQLLAYDHEGVKLVAPGGVRKTGDGLAEADVHTELFRPVELSVGVARSGLAHWRVDCKAGRLAVLSMSVYVGHNLSDKLATRNSPQRDWQDPVGSEAEAIRQVCLAAGETPPATMPM